MRELNAKAIVPGVQRDLIGDATRVRPLLSGSRWRRRDDFPGIDDLLAVYLSDASLLLLLTRTGRYILKPGKDLQ